MCVCVWGGGGVGGSRAPLNRRGITLLACGWSGLWQALKYEAFDDSLLARFLIRRGLWNPQEIGQPLFWLLKVGAAL